MLAVYTGNSLASLLPVASNDDASKSRLQSRVAFQATGGVPYQIAVDGYGPFDVGNILFHVSFSNAAPFVLVQPLSQQALAGSNVLFNVGATGVAQLRYQWRYNEADIPGATEPQYSLKAVQASQAGGYSAFGKQVTRRKAASTSLVRRRSDSGPREWPLAKHRTGARRSRAC